MAKYVSEFTGAEVLLAFYEDFNFPRSPAGGAPHIAAVKVEVTTNEILFRECGGYFQNRAYAGIVPSDLSSPLSNLRLDRLEASSLKVSCPQQ